MAAGRVVTMKDIAATVDISLNFGVKEQNSNALNFSVALLRDTFS
jgi:hypothetical protein